VQAGSLHHNQFAAGIVSGTRTKGEKMSPGPRTSIEIGCLIRTTARRFGWNDRFVRLPCDRAKPTRCAIETGKVAKIATESVKVAKTVCVAVAMLAALAFYPRNRRVLQAGPRPPTSPVGDLDRDIQNG
jgi:hypothetical protein